MNEEHDNQLIEKLRTTIDSQNLVKKTGPLEFTLLKELNSLEKRILVEKHLISPEHAGSSSGGVIFSKDQSISIMVKEEDHLRIQCILPGLQITDSYNMANTLDDLLEENLDYAFHERYGYLTACPTNVGTGMRASVMMHLPGLVLTKQVNKVLTALSQVGLVVRGIYGEGTEPLGNLFQISNGTTIGRSEEEVVTNLSSVIKQIIDQERVARERFYNGNKLHLEDKIMRAKGILENAKLMDSDEALKLISALKLGIDLGIIEAINLKVYYNLLVAIQPAYLQYTSGQRGMGPEERDKKRAEIIKEILRK
jgi:protein arginine kinase